MPVVINGTTGISGVDGSTGTPAFQGSDTNTGIRFGTDIVSLVTGGSDRLYIDSSGRLGVGTSSPVSGAQLTVAGSALAITGQNLDHSANSIRIGEEGSGAAQIRCYGPDGSTNGSLTFRMSRSDGSNSQDIVIDSSGRLGVGTTTVNTTLEVFNSSTPIIRVGDGTRHVELRGGSTTQNPGIGTNYAGSFDILQNGNPAVTVDPSKRFLFGTSSSISNIWVGGASYQSSLQIAGSAAGYGTGLALVNYHADGYAPTLSFGTSKNSSIGGNGLATNNTDLGIINFTGNDGTNFRSGAYILATVDGTSGSADLPTRLSLWTTADGAGSPTERMRISSTGAVSIYYGATFTRGSGAGISYPDWRVYNSTSNQYIIDNYSVGVKLDNGATAWSTVSDERQKINLQPIENGLNKISALRAVTGRYLEDAEDVSRSFLIAQDVQAVLPEAVSVDSDEDETLGLRYTEVIPLLVAALKESKERIETLEAKVAAFERA